MFYLVKWSQPKDADTTAFFCRDYEKSQFRLG